MVVAARATAVAARATAAADWDTTVAAITMARLARATRVAVWALGEGSVGEGEGGASVLHLLV